MPAQHAQKHNYNEHRRLHERSTHHVDNFHHVREGDTRRKEAALSSQTHGENQTPDSVSLLGGSLDRLGWLASFGVSVCVCMHTSFCFFRDPRRCRFCVCVWRNQHDDFVFVYNICCFSVYLVCFSCRRRRLRDF